MEAFVLVADNCPRSRALRRRRRASAVKALADSVGTEGMIGGQQADLDVGGKSGRFRDARVHLQPQDRRALHRVRGARGHHSRGREEFELDALRNYAKNLGLAFQVRDDILDAVGSKEKLGKDVHQDSNRTTFASQFGVESARKAVADLCRAAEESLCRRCRADPTPLVALARHVSVVEG